VKTIFSTKPLENPSPSITVCHISWSFTVTPWTTLENHCLRSDHHQSSSPSFVFRLWNILVTFSRVSPGFCSFSSPIFFVNAVSLVRSMFFWSLSKFEWWRFFSRRIKRKISSSDWFCDDDFSLKAIIETLSEGKKIDLRTIRFSGHNFVRFW